MKTAKQWCEDPELTALLEAIDAIFYPMTKNTKDAFMYLIEQIQKDAFESGVIATRHHRLDPSPEELWKEKILEQGFRHPQA